LLFEIFKGVSSRSSSSPRNLSACPWRRLFSVSDTYGKLCSALSSSTQSKLGLRFLQVSTVAGAHGAIEPAPERIGGRLGKVVRPLEEDVAARQLLRCILENHGEDAPVGVEIVFLGDRGVHGVRRPRLVDTDRRPPLRRTPGALTYDSLIHPFLPAKTVPADTLDSDGRGS
jgi:hypothetical protein